MNKFTFRRGVHPPDRKSRSAGEAVRAMPAPGIVKVPLSQHIGAPCEPVVREGETVRKGQLIGHTDKGLSARVFSPVFGRVTGTEIIQTPSGGRVPHLVIENGGEGEEFRLSPLSDPGPLEIVERVREAGIVGMGGAAFPTHAKLTPPKDKPIDTLIVNGAECEPYITCDARLMEERAAEVFEGGLLLQRAVRAERLVFGVEENKPEAVRLLREAGAEVAVLKTKYPQGAEKQLIYALTGRKVPAGGLPMDVGAVVDNVHTAWSVFRAVREGKTCYERVMTVSGGAVSAQNLLVPTGVSFAEVLEFCGGLKAEALKVLSGGPMMGFAQFNLAARTSKATGALLFLTAEELNTDKAGPCINCARCARACPMRLMPMYIDGFTLAGDLPGAKRYGALHCIECGCCAYSCPAKRPLVQSIRLAKKLIKARNI